jgi:hypothetical protein
MRFQLVLPAVFSGPSLQMPGGAKSFDNVSRLLTVPEVAPRTESRLRWSVHAMPTPERQVRQVHR